MYGIPQEVRIAHDDLVKKLGPYGYHPSRKTIGLWTYKNWPIKFTLVVDDFGVKYLGKENSLHLKAVLEYKYTVTTYWVDKLYIGIALKWDYEKGTVHISIPGYLRAALHSFQHKKPKIPQDLTYLWTQPIYVKTIIYYQKRHQLKN